MLADPPPDPSSRGPAIFPAVWAGRPGQWGNRKPVGLSKWQLDAQQHGSGNIELAPTVGSSGPGKRWEVFGLETKKRVQKALNYMTIFLSRVRPTCLCLACL